MFSKESRLQYTIDKSKVVNGHYYKVKENDNNNKHDDYYNSHSTINNDDIDDNNYDNNDNHVDNNYDDNNYDDLIRYIQHIQGVDSYMIPMNALSHQYHYHGPLYINNTIRIINYLQDHLCYESFYQDDYVVSFLLDISNINMISLRDSSCSYTDDNINNQEEKDYDDDDDVKNKKEEEGDGNDNNTKVMIHNINGVSKFFYQMHMSEDVFIREYITQQCLMNNIEQLLQLITTD